jgi:hypothetical protein
MGALVLRLSNVIVLMICVAWLTTTLSIESLVATLTLFVTLAGQELAAARASRDSPDIALFQEFLEDLPSEGSISFIKDYDFHAAFRLSNLDRLYDFRTKWSKPEREFRDRRLNKRRRRLLEAIEKFVSLIGQHTSPQCADINSLSPTLQHNDPEGYARIGDEINDAADLVFQRHTQMIKTGRSKLRV